MRNNPVLKTELVLKEQTLPVSIIQGTGLAVKVSVLLVLSIIWAVIALPAVILYMLFYKHLIEKIFIRIRQEKRKSPYYYKWKDHHLDLNWEA